VDITLFGLVVVTGYIATFILLIFCIVTIIVFVTEKYKWGGEAVLIKPWREIKRKK
jgi:hypothetical protein